MAPERLDALRELDMVITQGYHIDVPKANKMVQVEQELEQFLYAHSLSYRFCRVSTSGWVSTIRRITATPRHTDRNVITALIKNSRLKFHINLIFFII